MQYLVYENHSKFIKASETIKEVWNHIMNVFHSLQMKDDFQRLEDDMTKLRSRVIDIRTSSDTINEALSERKQQIMKLSSVHYLLKKVYQLKPIIE